MGLSAGARIGGFEVLGALGAGGMGEVYRARDLALGREVAVKILPAPFVADADWRRRFEREARLLASLTHANLAAVYRFDADTAPPLLVMELVPGETLSERIARGPRPVAEAVGLLAQIAAGLDAAHEAGIVHRDLKPGNVKVTPGGVVKILDFGLAKSLSAPGVFDRTTMTPASTDAGVVLGTAAYMSPEQARGAAVDARADIWAFGCIAYELLCGSRPFDEPTANDTIAAVLRADPDWPALDRAAPAPLAALIRRCLEKDPARRWRSAGDLRLLLDDAASAPVQSPAAPRTHPRVSRAAAIAWIVAALALVAAGAEWWRGRTIAPAPAAWQRFVQLTDLAGVELDPRISPDGASIVYARNTGRSIDLFVQRVGGHTPIAVASNPEVNERSPAFSPDGSTIAFHHAGPAGGIFIVGATGESERRLTDFGFHPTWSPGGDRVAFCTEDVLAPGARFSTSALWVVDVKGGQPRQIYKGDAVQPAWSPTGRRIAFMALGTNDQRDIYTLAADGLGAPVHVTDDAALDGFPEWAPDGRSLYYASDRSGVMNVWRTPIDESSGRPTGPGEPVTASVASIATEPSLSRDGTRLVFRSGSSNVAPYVLPLNLGPGAGSLGAPKAVVDRMGSMRPHAVSADGQWLALTNQGEAQEDLFISRIDGRDFRRLTDDAFRDRAPVWSLDGTRLAFYSNRAGHGMQIWTIRTDGSGLTQITDFNDVGDLYFPVFGGAGDHIYASIARTHRVVDLDLHASLPIRTITELPNVSTDGASFTTQSTSPDGKWMAGPLLNAGGAAVGVGLYDLTARRVVKLSSDRDTSYAWLPGGRLIVNLRDRLAIIDIASRERREVPIPNALVFNTIVASPDGRWLYVGLAKTEGDVWMATSR